MKNDILFFLLASFMYQSVSRGSFMMPREFLILIRLASCVLMICPVGCGGKGPSMTRIELSLTAPDLPRDTVGARPKTIYLAGERYARIEQFADLTSDRKNLIIVSEPDIWLVDAVHKTVSHSVNHGPDLTVHNPILGPDGPEELFPLEYGREVDFFKANASRLPPQELDGTRCDVRQMTLHGYRLRLYVDSRRQIPVEMEAFKDGEFVLRVRYDSYRTDLPLDSSLFEPPNGLTVVEASD